MKDIAAVRTRLMSYPRVTMYDDDVQAMIAAYDVLAAQLAYVYTHDANLGAGWLSLYQWREGLAAAGTAAKEGIVQKTHPLLCDHCLGVIAGEERRIEIDGVRSTTMRITLCEPCYHKLVATMRLGS